MKYAFDVLEGTHATHRVQVAKIEGALPEPYYYVIYKVDTATTKARNNATGVVSTIQVIYR